MGKPVHTITALQIKPDDLDDNQKRALFALDLDYDYFNVSKRVDAKGVIHV